MDHRARRDRLRHLGRSDLGSDKFLRKWLWLLLTLLTFTLRWPASDTVTVGVGIPLGALYVLGFARFGPAPTAEAVAKRRRTDSPPLAATGSLQLLRAAYGLLALAFFGILAWLTFGPLMPTLLAQVGGGGDALPGFRTSMLAFGLVFGGFLVFLAARPYPWAKLVCGFAAFAWLTHGLISLLILPQVLGPSFPAATHAAITAGAGLVAAACGIVHYRIDPRLSGPPLWGAGPANRP